jgi:hypothetical protein
MRATGLVLLLAFLEVVYGVCILLFAIDDDVDDVLAGCCGSSSSIINLLCICYQHCNNNTNNGNAGTIEDGELKWGLRSTCYMAMVYCGDLQRHARLQSFSH